MGQTFTVLVDGHDGDYAIARSMADAPDIDGKVYLRDGKLLSQVILSMLKLNLMINMICSQALMFKKKSQ